MAYLRLNQLNQQVRRGIYELQKSVSRILTQYGDFNFCIQVTYNILCIKTFDKNFIQAHRGCKILITGTRIRGPSFNRRSVFALDCR